ncbi:MULTISPECIES: hypothetical protein [Nostocales]|uniref:Uncharacterized protein n=3 Tax=Nostocales TaxID=1161 RepID=A0A0C1NG28_9CYAN|nr:hypothetical protein [Tolypothrix bouteillei]KAF3884760.1 hypothetical protein DA73_0400004270 [Tolypothrix bouteillei VB521301]
MKLKLSTFSFLTISIIVASGIQSAEATRVTNNIDRQNYTRSIAFDRIPSMLETGDRLKTESPYSPARAEIAKIDRVSSGNKLQRLNPQPILIASQCKSPCKTEI